MPLKRHFVCPLPNGVHARPASALEEVVRGFESEVILFNQRTRRAANSRSILAIVGADIRHDDPCIITVSGPDEQEAMATLAAFWDEQFPHCDAPLSPALPADDQVPLPPCLREAGATVYRGTPLVSGIGQGHAVRAGGFHVPATLTDGETAEPAAEWQRLETALNKLTEHYEQRLLAVEPGIESELLKVYRAIARDVEFRRQLHGAVFKHRRSAAGAIVEAQTHFAQVLGASGSALLRERALDIQDVCFQLLRQLYGEAVGESKIELTANTVVVADSLTPGQFLALNRNFLKGLVLTNASVTSHTVILARSFNIPTLGNVENSGAIPFNGQEVVVDADAGVLVTALPEAARRYYAMEQRRLAGRQARLRRFGARPAATQDGARVAILANIATTSEAASAFAAGAEGIGLFRTEMLFLDRKAPPDEAEQFDTYRRLLVAAGDRPVVIRTLDVGGDKKLNYLNLPAEENPFLGCRAVRLYPEFESLFRVQVRALIRASACGRLKVMVPMIATVNEARFIKRIIAEEQQKCAAEKIPFDPAMPVGAMIEVPAAAFALEPLCRELDFFSLGTNDLLQYFMAADRANARVASLYQPLQPAFLRLLKQVAATARAQDREISLCGEMGSNVRLLPLLVGLGLDKISAAIPSIVHLKAELAELKRADCVRLLNAALHCATAEEVADLLEEFTTQRGAPLLDPELILTSADAASREEAIKLAADQLFVVGRTEEPRAIEEAIWQRERVYSTGFGYGFAIPHCKTNAVRANSLVLLKPRAPLAWNSLDGEPVRVVILLAVRETQAAVAHMKILARLSRRLMDADFRASLEAEDTPARLCEILQTAVEAEANEKANHEPVY